MRIKEILSIDNFDPLNIDISFRDSVSNQVPQEGYMDPAMAEHLATTTLRAADTCIDLLAQATLYLSHCDAQRRSVRSQVIKTLQDRKVPSTIVKEVYADDERYLTITNKYNLALALSTWLENKHDTLLKTHHLCKDLIRKSQGTQGASNWESSETSRPRLSHNLPDEEEKLPTTSNNSFDKRSAWKV